MGIPWGNGENMYRRKVQYHKGTFYIALPKEIVEAWNLKKGEDVLMEYSNGKLIVEKDTSFKPASELLGTKRHGRVYTIGYEGKTVDEFIDELIEHNIVRLIDVRELPLSRKNGFSKKALEKELRLAGIEYLSLTSLGAPKELRRDLRSNLMNFFEFARLYRRYLEEHIEELKVLEVYISTKTSALMCFEADWRECHRSIIAEFLERDGFEVVHL